MILINTKKHPSHKYCHKFNDLWSICLQLTNEGKICGQHCVYAIGHHPECRAARANENQLYQIHGCCQVAHLAKPFYKVPKGKDSSIAVGGADDHTSVKKRWCRPRRWYWILFHEKNFWTFDKIRKQGQICIQMTILNRFLEF